MKNTYLSLILKNILAFICFSAAITVSAQTSKIQFVNNSPDPAMDSVDIYINGVLAVPSLGFRNATPYIVVTDSVQCSIAVAPKHSTDSSQAIFRSSETLVSGTWYYKVISGVINTANFSANPNGVSTAFTVYTYSGAKDTSTVVVNGVHQNVDLLYHHGSPDLMKTTMQTNNGAMFISKNDPYGAFHSSYAYQAPLDNLNFNLNDALTDTVLLPNAVGNISSRVGQAGLIFCSGFYTYLKWSFDPTKTLTASQKSRILGLFIAWSDGKVDTIQPVLSIITGINEIVSANQFRANFYPNPASNVLNISFELSSPSVVFVQFYDINGRKILSTNQTVKSSGKNNIELDLKNIDNGIYFCSVTIGGQRIIRKISVMK